MSATSNALEPQSRIAGWRRFGLFFSAHGLSACELSVHDHLARSLAKKT
jgi:hypothetical protein